MERKRKVRNYTLLLLAAVMVLLILSVVMGSYQTKSTKEFRWQTFASAEKLPEYGGKFIHFPVYFRLDKLQTSMKATIDPIDKMQYIENVTVYQSTDGNMHVVLADEKGNTIEKLD
jgi:hypothetical protein